MSQNFNITMKQYNGTDYDVLYPATVDGQVGLSSEAQDYYPSGYGLEDVLVQNAQRTEAIGTVRITTRNDLDSSWVPCDGSVFDDTQYPELYSITSPEINNKVLQTTLSLPITLESNIYYNYCNNMHIIAGKNADTNDICLLTTEDIENPNWQVHVTNNLSSNNFKNIVYSEKSGIYIAGYCMNYGPISWGIYKSNDLITWTQLSGAITPLGVFSYDSINDVLYMHTINLTSSISSNYYDYVYKSTDFSTWELVYSESIGTTSYNNSICSIYSYGNYLYLSRGCNLSSSYNQNKIMLYNIEQNQVTNSSFYSGASCSIFLGYGDFIIRIPGKAGGNSFTPTSSGPIYSASAGSFSFTQITIPFNFGNTSSGMHLSYYMNCYIISQAGVGMFSFNKNGAIVNTTKNIPSNSNRGFAFVNNYYEIVPVGPSDSSHPYLYYLAIQLPTIELTNATAYIKATQTPST